MVSPCNRPARFEIAITCFFIMRSIISVTAPMVAPCNRTCAASDTVSVFSWLTKVTRPHASQTEPSRQAQRLLLLLLLLNLSAAAD